MDVWRLVKTRFAPTAFDGEGARLYGARWNSRGTRAAYASSNSALAVLEVLVHMAGGGALPPLPGYSIVMASLPDALVDELDVSRLPADWSASPVPPSVQAIGDAWVGAGRSLATRVPSVLVAGGSNLLINPAHADFPRLAVRSITPFTFDARLLR